MRKWGQGRLFGGPFEKDGRVDRKDEKMSSFFNGSLMDEKNGGPAGERIFGRPYEIIY